MSDQISTELREAVRARYAEAARAVLEPKAGVTASCCGSSAADSCCGTGSAALDSADSFGGPLYGEGETDGLPEEAVLASLGCGDPLAVADLREGDRVLDVGSGGGIDVLLSASRVGPSGFAYGVDMTDDMLELARKNAAKAGVANVEFRKGQIEALPLPDASVDVVISNCVINLSVDKPAVLAEMYRVLVPGGRIGIADVVAEDHMSPADRAAAGSYAGCIAGALSRAEYLDGLAAAGFADAVSHLHARGSPGHALGDHTRGQARRLTAGIGRQAIAGRLLAPLARAWQDLAGSSGAAEGCLTAARRSGQETAARRGARRPTRLASWASAASKLSGSPTGTGSGMDQCTAVASASSSWARSHTVITRSPCCRTSLMWRGRSRGSGRRWRPAAAIAPGSIAAAGRVPADTAGTLLVWRHSAAARCERAELAVHTNSTRSAARAGGRASESREPGMSCR